jgi:hypothetical protein
MFADERSSAKFLRQAVGISRIVGKLTIASVLAT